MTRLVKKFAADEAHYTSSGGAYKEADTRSEFIDPLLAALGWDVTNASAVTPTLKEVVREQSQEQEDSATKFPDYTLQINGARRLYVEAKKPSVDVTSHLESIFQARRYGYSGIHPIVVLTNFRDLVVYDTTVPISGLDRPTTCRIFTWHYTEFAAEFHEIRRVLGRAEVADAAWAGQFKTTAPQQPVPAGEAFIRHYNDWRLALARDLVGQDPALDEVELNDAVQRVLSRLIFVRMCEDRGIEGERTLRSSAATGSLPALLSRLHRRYNTGLFQTRSGDLTLKVSPHILDSIVNNLYAPLSTFSFAVLDANFLGLVYETSLAEHLVIDRSGKHPVVSLREKREYEHREVVTTPQTLVETTVRHAMDALDPGLNEPRVLDFAVGSGRFLLAVFDRVIEQETSRQIAVGSPNLIQTAPNEWRLGFEEKRRLLVENLYGIDIDYNAVEIAKFSLLVRLLQDENKAILPAQGTRSILPDLSGNIAWGNTLVRALPGASEEQEALTNPLDLDKTKLPAEFDVIVGNPPYMKTEDMKRFDPIELSYLDSEYRTAFQQFDKYFAFIEFASDHLAQDGVLGAIVPNKWMTLVAGRNLRQLLRSDLTVARLDNFREVQVFPGKSIYVCSLVAKKRSGGTFTYSEPGSIASFGDQSARTYRVLRSRLPTSLQGAWVIPTSSEEDRVLRAIHTNAVPLDDVVEPRNGIQTSAVRVYVIQNYRTVGKFVEFEDYAGVTRRVEAAVTRPYLTDSRNIRSHHEVRPDSLVLFPYERASARTSTSGWEVIPEARMRRVYPQAHAYFLAHRPALDRRNVAADQRAKAFYVYGRPQATGYAALAPKIFYSNNQRGDKYGLDTTGVVYASGGTGGEVALFAKNSNYSLDFILGLLDQAPIEYFLRKRGSVFRGGYYARGTDVIGDTPVPRLDLVDPTDRAFHDEVANHMRALRKLNAKTPTVTDRNLAKHAAKIAAARDKVRDAFLVRWGLARPDVDALEH